MRIGILAHNGHDFVRPMSEALARQCVGLGHEVRVAYHAHQLLRSGPDPSNLVGPKRRLKRALAPIYFRALRACDLLVVVSHMPEAFRQVLAVHDLRRWAPGRPIVLYDLVYLPTLGIWGPWRNPPDVRYRLTAAEYAGMERYDWYLCISDVNRQGVPPGPQPYTRVGIDLRDASLVPEQRGFRALIDFERQDCRHAREVQLRALRETGTEYVELRGDYSLRDIRGIYRQTSLYFVAHMESYGLPISELQACGACIATPYADWCQSHGMKADRHAEGLGQLSPNFIVYGNDVECLKRELERLKATYSPQHVLQNLRSHQPHLIDGDGAALADFLMRVERGEITATSHRQYGSLMGQTAQRT